MGYNYHNYNNYNENYNYIHTFVDINSWYILKVEYVRNINKGNIINLL